MTHLDENTIRVRVDPTNPGQFFACCGLLELADRLWGGAEGWFDNDSLGFNLRSLSASDVTTEGLLVQVVHGALSNTMTAAQLGRRESLGAIPKKVRSKAMEAEKAKLDGIWREAPVFLGQPFGILLDWFRDDRSGGSDLKTWAGQQSVIEIARSMQSAAGSVLNGLPPERCLSAIAANDSLPFNFDSDLGAVGGALDVGFSFDPLKDFTIRMKPLTEFAAFVGLQRFRPRRKNKENSYRYGMWKQPLEPQVAQVAACGLLDTKETAIWEFRLLYRTKYLKSFLPSQPTGGPQ
jgi:CRISPR-associated protein Csb3